MRITRKELASYIDHTNLKPKASEREIEKLCSEAVEYGFFAVCINPFYVSLASSLLRKTQVKVCSVVGFPLGQNESEVKAYEAERAVRNGASEIDMVLNLGALKDERYEFLREEIEAVVKASRGRGVKVIIETCFLTQREKIKACELSREAGAQFVKTSTGFGSGGAIIDDVKLMKKTVPELEIKASGGIESAEFAMQLIKAGATRLGASRGVEILKEFEKIEI